MYQTPPSYWLEPSSCVSQVTSFSPALFPKSIDEHSKQDQPQALS